MSRIFISHSTKDAPFVLEHLKPGFARLGMVCWVSATDVQVAADWETQIRSALAQSDWFLVVLSPDAGKSEWVRAETHWALERMPGRVVPVMARACDPTEIHLRLGTLQFIDFQIQPARAMQRLEALIVNPVSGGATRIHDPAPGANPECTTLLTKPRLVEVRVEIETGSQPTYEQRLHLHNWGTIGRAEDADLRIADGCVSRKHARLSAVPTDQGIGLTLTDLGSANGTFLNGRRIDSSETLAIGDLILVGNARLKIRGII